MTTTVRGTFTADAWLDKRSKVSLDASQQIADIDSPYWRMSNGDLVLFTNKANGGSAFYTVSLDNGASWRNPVAYADMNNAVTICRSQSTANVLYVLCGLGTAVATGLKITYNTSTHTFSTTTTGTLKTLNVNTQYFAGPFAIFHDGSAVHTMWQEYGINTTGGPIVLSAWTGSFTGNASFNKQLEDFTYHGAGVGAGVIGRSKTSELLVCHPVATQTQYEVFIRPVTVGASSYTLKTKEKDITAMSAVFIHDQNDNNIVVTAGADNNWVEDPNSLNNTASPTSPFGSSTTSGQGAIVVTASGVTSYTRAPDGTSSNGRTFIGPTQTVTPHYDPTTGQMTGAQTSGDIPTGLSGTLLFSTEYRPVVAYAIGNVVFLWRYIANGWELDGQPIIPSTPSAVNYYGRPIGLAQQASTSTFSAITGTAANLAFGYGYYNASILLEDIFADFFDLNHPPQIVLTSPADGTQTFDEAVDQVPITWSYTDSDDTLTTQKQYEVQVVENKIDAVTKYVTAAGTLQTAVATVTSSSQSAHINAGQIAPSAYGYLVRVRASDQHDAFSSWTSYSLFYVNTKPSVSITTVNITSNQPTITWTYTDPDGSAQSATRMKVYENVTNNTLYDSGPVPATPPLVVSGGTASQMISGFVLQNATRYTIGVQSADITGLWSAEATISILTNIKYPAAPMVTVDFDVYGVPTVTCASGVVSGALTTPVKADLYRWSPVLNTYVIIASGLAPSFFFRDPGGVVNATVRYKVVTKDINNSQVETLSVDKSFSYDDWMLVSTTVNLPLVASEFTVSIPKPVEQLEAMGRTHVIAIAFNSTGREGNLTISVEPSDRETTLSSLASLINSSSDVYLRSPFGETFCVSIGSPTKTYLVSGRLNMTIPYIEVKDA